MSETGPVRIQRRRTRGWRMPDYTVYVGRPSKWGDPWETADEYRLWLCRLDLGWKPFRRSRILHDMCELRGLNLACWCPLDQPCHADVLLELANKEAQP